MYTFFLRPLLGVSNIRMVMVDNNNIHFNDYNVIVAHMQQ